MRSSRSPDEIANLPMLDLAYTNKKQYLNSSAQYKEDSNNRNYFSFSNKTK
jgi:hypothetical protein